MILAKAKVLQFEGGGGTIMLVAFASKTGNVKAFVDKLSEQCEISTLHIKPDEIEKVNEPFILITYTTGIGKTPQEVLDFLAVNSHLMVGVVGSGNMNWGLTYCRASVDIATRYDLPLIHRFELRGMASDVSIVKEFIENEK